MVQYQQFWGSLWIMPVALPTCTLTIQGLEETVDKIQPPDRLIAQPSLQRESCDFPLLAIATGAQSWPESIQPTLWSTVPLKGEALEIHVPSLSRTTPQAPQSRMVSPKRLATAKNKWRDPALCSIYYPTPSILHQKVSVAEAPESRHAHEHWESHE